MTLTVTFENLGLRDIEEYLRTKQEETVQLDFETTSSPDLNRDDSIRKMSVRLCQLEWRSHHMGY